MKRGTRVGEAYVALTADGTGLNQDIVDEVDEAGAGISKSSRGHADEYSDEFGDRLGERLEPIMERLGEQLSKRLSDRVGRGLRGSFSSTAENSIQKRLADALGESLEGTMAGIEDRIAEEVRKVSGNSGGSSGGGGGGRGSGPGSPSFPSQGPDPDRDRAVWMLAQQMNEKFDRERTVLLARAARADEEFDRQRTLMLDRAYRLNEDHDRRLGLMVDRALKMNEDHDRRLGIMVDRAMQMNEKFNRDRGIMMDRALKDNEAFDRARALMVERAIKMNKEFEANRLDAIQKEGRMLDRAYELNDKFDRDRHLMLERAHAQNDTFDRTRTKMLAEAHRMNMAFENGRLSGDGRSTGSGGGGDSRLFGDRIGGLLGSGSRNNLLNLIGRSAGNLINLFQRLGRVSASLFKTFSDGFKQAGDNASLFTKLGGGAGAVMSSLTAAGPALAAGIIAIAVSLSILVSVASALLALLTAITSTIVSGLVGALTVLGGALLAVVAAGGLLTAAFTSMTDEQKKFMGATFQPLKAELTGIGQLMITEMIPYFKTWSDNLQQALLLAVPAAQVMGDAFGKAGASLTAAFSGPGFQNFSRALGVYLPGIVMSLSKALGAFLNGVTGLFAALMPHVQRFASYLEDVATRFSDWANSASGRNAIVDFTDRALDSLQSLWDFTREFFGWLSDILFSAPAQKAGNTIFDSLARSFAGLRDRLDDGTLEKWFQDAIDFAKSWKKALVGVKDVISALNSSGVLKAVGGLFRVMGWSLTTLVNVGEAVVDFFRNELPNALTSALGPVRTLADALGILEGTLKSVLELGKTTLFSLGQAPFVPPMEAAGAGGALGANFAGGTGGPSLQDLINSGNSALDATSESSGGNIPDGYKNPYQAYAESLMQTSPTIEKQIKQMLRKLGRSISKALSDAAKAATAGEAKSAIRDMVDSMKASASTIVDNARANLDSAASSLSSASSAGAAAKALAEVRASQAALEAALKNQNRIDRMANKLDKQKVVSGNKVKRLLDGLKVQNATLADYAAARDRLTTRLEKANQKLVDAIAMRKNYKSAVKDAAIAFGSILSAQAQTIDGIEQALTATDITTNLQDRLAKIKAFQDNLRILLAQGLSNDAYKQIVDGGVENGSAYAAALVEGGIGAIAQVNSLVSQIDGVANSLGNQTADRLYAAGVSAAQGLVDGLESMSDKLDNAATRLGNAIARAIKKSLGIKSPSRVMRDSMNSVGDGLVLGLDDQHRQVERAANRLSSQIQVAPSAEVARYEAAQARAAMVSGNQPVAAAGTSHTWNIVTPTEDPEAVAREAINEMTGRL